MNRFRYEVLMKGRKGQGKIDLGWRRDNGRTPVHCKLNASQASPLLMVERVHALACSKALLLSFKV